MTIRPALLGWCTFSFFSAVAAILLAGLDNAAASLLFASVAAVGLVAAGFVYAGGFNNLVFIFLAFHLLYGLSGPLNALYGTPLPPLFSLPYETSAFLESFSYASIGLAAAFALFSGLMDPTAIGPAAVTVDPRTLAQLAVAFAALASAMELSNLTRVGLGSLLQGKAIYQSAVDALPLTAPSYDVAKIAFSLFGLATAGFKLLKGVDSRFRPARYAKMFLLLLSPLALLSLFLGRRGPMLDSIVIFFVASTWYVWRRRIGRGIAFGIVATYVVMGMIFANRATLAYSFYVGDYSLLADHVRQREVIVSGLNPGANEFGAAFGNFSEYVKYDVEGPQFGRTYVEGLALVVPSFLYPGTKPEPVAYAFRDRFFPGVESEGAIASTAYSSILEAYVNFRQMGVMIVYFLVGLVLTIIEANRRRSDSTVFALAYLAVLPSAIVFHRADFGASVIGPVFYSLVMIAGVAAFLAGFEAFGGAALRTSPISAGTGDA
jgi:O-antigen polysaccharide polymerase Wzy